MLVVVMTGAVGLWLVSWVGVGTKRSEYHLARDATAAMMMGAGGSWLVFMIANVFITLWIFKNLWWLAGADGLLILATGGVSLGRHYFRMIGRASVIAAASCVLGVTGLWGVGKWMRSDVRIVYHSEDKTVVIGRGKCDGRVLVFPEESVLGKDWGKEIRRLAQAKDFQNLEITTPSGNFSEPVMFGGKSPQTIIACGIKFQNGIATLLQFPEADLILVHPLGTPVIPQGFKGKVTVILPSLDTKNSGRRWKNACRRMGWKWVMSPGVGQDVRLVWPSILNP